MQQYSQALASYDKAIAIEPNKHQAYYNKACTYALQKDTTAAISNLQKAMKLVPGKYEKLAKTDPDFAEILDEEEFRDLVN